MLLGVKPNLEARVLCASLIERATEQKLTRAGTDVEKTTSQVNASKLLGNLNSPERFRTLKAQESWPTTKITPMRHRERSWDIISPGGRFLSENRRASQLPGINARRGWAFVVWLSSFTQRGSPGPLAPRQSYAGEDHPAASPRTHSQLVG
jgi:hypothetical protein